MLDGRPGSSLGRCRLGKRLDECSERQNQGASLSESRLEFEDGNEDDERRSGGALRWRRWVGLGHWGGYG